MPDSFILRVWKYLRVSGGYCTVQFAHGVHKTCSIGFLFQYWEPFVLTPVCVMLYTEGSKVQCDVFNRD